VEQARDAMSARVEIGDGADLIYQEAHHHGDLGGIEVMLRTIIRLGSRARYRANLSPVAGPVGRLDIDDQVPLGTALN